MRAARIGRLRHGSVRRKHEAKRAEKLAWRLKVADLLPKLRAEQALKLANRAVADAMKVAAENSAIR